MSALVQTTRDSEEITEATPVTANTNSYGPAVVSGHGTLFQGDVLHSVFNIGRAVIHGSQHRRQHDETEQHAISLGEANTQHKAIGRLTRRNAHWRLWLGILLAIATLVALVMAPLLTRNKLDSLPRRPRLISPANVPSVAVDAVAWYRYKIFYIDKDSGSIKGISIGRGSGAENHGSITGLKFSPSMSNNLALAYWMSGAREEVKLYYIDQKYSKVIELGLNCPTLSPCDYDWKFLPAYNVSNTTNLAVLHYTTLARIFLFYINTDNEISVTSANYGEVGAWQPSRSLGVPVYPGSSLAAVMTSWAPFEFAVYHFDPQQRLAVLNLTDDAPYSNATHLVQIKNNLNTTFEPYTTLPLANLAAASIPKTSSDSYQSIRLFHPSRDGRHLDELFETSTKDGGYSFDRNTLDHLAPVDDSQNSGFAAGAYSWSYQTVGDTYTTRMWYPVKGVLEQAGNDNSSWWWGPTVDD